jgi:hypothetical protein
MSGEEIGRGAKGLSWFKSSYSAGNGGECIEVAVAWRKSSRSTGSGGECVEIAACLDTVHIRDSKDKPGPVLDFTPAAWSTFVTFAAQQDV